MLHRIKVQQLVASLAVVQCLGHHHFAVEQGPAADLPHQHTEVAIGAIKHRCHAEAVALLDGVNGGVHESMLPVERQPSRLEPVPLNPEV